MSFRSASDYTNIAQLIGRLVRTPLAREVQGDDFLNSVALYLPGYEAGALEKVQKYLTSRETGLAAPPDIERGENLVEYPPAAGKDELFEKAATLPTYQIQRLSKKTNVQRLIKLSWHLTNDKIEPGALASARQFVIDALEAARRKRARTKAFKDAVKRTSQIAVRAVIMETPIAGDDVDDPTLEESFNQVVAAAENVDDVFRACGRRLGEGLHKQWLKARVAAGAMPTEAKAELYALLADDKLWQLLQAECGKRFWEKKRAHKPAISALPESRRQQYDKLNITGAKGTPLELALPPSMIVSKNAASYERHLYTDEGDAFSCKLNDWEVTTVEEELKRDGWRTLDVRAPARRRASGCRRPRRRDGRHARPVSGALRSAPSWRRCRRPPTPRNRPRRKDGGRPAAADGCARPRKPRGSRSGAWLHRGSDPVVLCPGGRERHPGIRRGK